MKAFFQDETYLEMEIAACFFFSGEEWIRSTFIIEEKRFDEDCSEFFQNSPIAKIARGKHFLLEYSMLDERGDEEKGNYFYDRSIHDYMCKKIESANAGSDTDSELLRRFNILYKIIEDVGSYSMNPNLGQFTRNYTQTVKRAADNKRRYAR